MGVKRAVDPAMCKEEDRVSENHKCCNLCLSLTAKPSCYFRITVSSTMLFPLTSRSEIIIILCAI